MVENNFSELLAWSIERTYVLRKKWPESSIIEILEDQLRYLQDFYSEKIKDSTFLQEIDLGRIAAKEIEDSDPELANVLYKLQKHVRNLKLKHRKKQL